MKKIKLLMIAFTISIISAKAQWTGPTSGILSTNNQVNISGVMVSTLPGSPPTTSTFQYIYKHRFSL